MEETSDRQKPVSEPHSSGICPVCKQAIRIVIGMGFGADAKSVCGCPQSSTKGWG